MAPIVQMLLLLLSAVFAASPLLAVTDDYGRQQPLHPSPVSSLYTTPTSPHDIRPLFTQVQHDTVQLRQPELLSFISTLTATSTAFSSAQEEDEMVLAAIPNTPSAFLLDILAPLDGDETGNGSSAAANSSQPAPGVFIVRVKAPVSARLRELLSASLASTGYSLFAYLPHNAFLLAPDSPTANATGLQEWELSSPHAQSITPYHPHYKVDPMLRQTALHIARTAPLRRPSHYHAVLNRAGCSVDELAVADNEVSSADGSTIQADNTATPSGVWELSVSVFTSSSYDSPQQLIHRWSHNRSLAGVRLEAWSPSTVGVFIPSQPATSASSAVLPVVAFFSLQPEVEWIETAADFETTNKHAASITQSGSFTAPSHPLWDRKLTGAGQIVSIGDTGVAWASCFFSDEQVEIPIDRVDHRHRKIVSYWATQNKTYDNVNGHGTHTACSIAGNIVMPAGSSVAVSSVLSSLAEYRGVAFDAKLAVFDFNSGHVKTRIRTPRNLISGFFQKSHDAGARISSNSWGARNGSYIRESRDLDHFVSTQPDFLPVFASGNFGQRGFQTVVAPSSAKNALSIGAVRSSTIRRDAATHKADFCGSETESDDVTLDRTLCFFSGRGPTRDLRVKPEMPGEWIISARSNGNPEQPDCIDCQASLLPLFGTSMATAVAAGAVALVRQYYTDGFYPSGVADAAAGFLPSAALLKATMIAAAVPDVVDPTDSGSGFMDGSYAVISRTQPRPGVGFGRVELNSALSFQDDNSTPDLYVVDGRSLSTGDFHAFCFQTRDGSLPFSATLVWSDPAARLSSSWLLVNNLDLSVHLNSSSRLYLGNDHHIDTSAVTDVTNNAERVLLSPSVAAHPATLTVHVAAAHVPVAPQPYALVVTGHFVAVDVRLCAGLHVCPAHCEGRGQCSADGECRCDAGWAGADCSVGSEAITSCAAVSGRVLFGGWRFYHLELPMAAAASDGEWAVSMAALAGDPDLFLHVGRLPSLTDFNLSDPAAGLKQSRLSWSSSERDRVYIGVFGSCCVDSDFTLSICSTASDATAECACTPQTVGG